MQCVPYLFYPLLRVNSHSSTCIICYINMAEILPIRLKTLSNQSIKQYGYFFRIFCPTWHFFHSYRDVTITCTSEGLQFWPMLMALSTEGSLVCHSRALSIGAVATRFNDFVCRGVNSNTQPSACKANALTDHRRGSYSNWKGAFNQSPDLKHCTLSPRSTFLDRHFLQCVHFKNPIQLADCISNLIKIDVYNLLLLCHRV